MGTAHLRMVESQPGNLNFEQCILMIKMFDWYLCLVVWLRQFCITREQQTDEAAMSDTCDGRKAGYSNSFDGKYDGFVYASRARSSYH